MLSIYRKKHSISLCRQRLHIAILVLTTVATSGPVVGGEVSVQVGTIPDLVKQGYMFVAASGLGPEQNAVVPPLGENPNVIYQVGALYLGKQNDFVVCNYTIILSVGSVDTAPPSLTPHSAYYKIK
jgi:hypothetical protein